MADERKQRHARKDEERNLPAATAAMIVIVGLVVVIVHHKRRSNEIFVEFANVSCAKCLRKRHIESDANVLGCRHVVCNDCLKGEHACPVCTSDLSDFVSVVKPLRASTVCC